MNQDDWIHAYVVLQIQETDQDSQETGLGRFS